MFEEVTPRSEGRRSRLEVACEILGVISRGADKPTRIMQLANITWDDLLLHLAALIGGQLVSREVIGKKTRYSVTPKGSSLLESYERFRRDAEPLISNLVTKVQVLKALKSPLVASREALPYSALEERLRAEGLKILDNAVKGKSGAVHQFGIVAADRMGSKHAYQIFERIEPRQVLDLLLKQLDTDLIVHGTYLQNISLEATALARGYSIDISQWPS